MDVLETTMRLAHPVMPFITEVIWKITAPMLGRMHTDTIMSAAYPDGADYVKDREAEEAVSWLKDFATSVRNLRAEMKVGPSVKLSPMLRGASEAEENYTEKYFAYLENLANIDKVVFVKAGDNLPPCSSKPLRTAEVLIPMKDLVNKDAEIKRLTGMAKKLEGVIASSEARLKSEAFISKAPAKIIEGAKAQLELNKTQLEKVKAQIEEMKNL